MRRNSDTRRGERIENLGYGLIAAALFASTAMAFVGAPLPIPAQRAAEVVQVRLEGLVVTPTRTYQPISTTIGTSSANRFCSGGLIISRAARPASTHCSNPLAGGPRRIDSSTLR